MGFGSQAIMNNFMSGLILIVERPVRVGDLIQIGELYGSVQHIGARSMRVITGENMEIVVPNSSFVENNAINWTLSESKVRVHVSVGVALMLPHDAVPPRITIAHLTPDHVEIVEDADLDTVQAHRGRPGVLWVDVQGIGDLAILERLGAEFQLHPLALEDVVNVPQRPKTETYDHHQLYISRMVESSPGGRISIEQVAILIGDDHVVTFRERPGTVLDPVRERLGESGSRIRESGADYLAYRIIDTIIDHYYPVIDALSERLESLEVLVMEHPEPGTLRDINRMKQALLEIRRAIWPQRDAINALVRGDSPYVSEPVRVYLRDSYDHAVQITDVVETYRDITSGLFNTYLSVVSNRTNEVMKVLTIMASIFIPLTFMAGIYGMNFEGMPELRVWWTYPLLLLLMAMVATGMLLFFRRKGWIGGSRDERRDDTDRRA
ncbi:MAG: magnesium/cobalt transporter CorA [Phycisphaerales bacterium]|nr:magnesium/cobalt transporter CorA [Phycisphaerales bacterium]